VGVRIQPWVPKGNPGRLFVVLSGAHETGERSPVEDPLWRQFTCLETPKLRSQKSNATKPTGNVRFNVITSLNRNHATIADECMGNVGLNLNRSIQPMQ